MSCNDHNHKGSNCVCDIVKFIDSIQDAQDDMGCPTSCLNPVLGASHSHGMMPNTRVFSLYGKNGDLFFAEFLTATCTTDSSQFFRVESVDDCCAVLRVLRLVSNNMAVCEFEATKQCIVVDLNCFCGIACIEDVFIPGV
ncbi:CotY/CotZ family spore coat protein [Ectobacillus ponti]|uniref:CotY/CotZ family spore coat protein n=1 Tax=Ectobacillus ponti TaxID=2961894 RepID=A0AA41XAB3_9BACI|nr:CotY/CotZ family spore coat protein [Ectobacillus ponti]MCP8968356.1 CotY/CotZ family spore coat protein [Ectobacillus ponti]